MPFTNTQLRQLRANIRPQVVKQREIEGKVLHYLEGWHIISEANRIFGFDAWDRETLQSQCVWQKQIDYRYAAAYLTRVRITVRAGDQVIQREGMGSGEALAGTAGQAHERASKAAETDATKRALSTFGNSFGLSLYRDKTEAPQSKKARQSARPATTAAEPTHAPSTPIHLEPALPAATLPPPRRSASAKRSAPAPRAGSRSSTTTRRARCRLSTRRGQPPFAGAPARPRTTRRMKMDRWWPTRRRPTRCGRGRRRGADGS